MSRCSGFARWYSSTRPLYYGPATLYAIRATVAAAAALVVALSLTSNYSDAFGWTRVVCPSGCAYSRIDSAITHSPSLGPGDIVQVNAGTYAQTVIVDSVGGSIASPATIRASGRVVIDGSNALTQWTLCQGNVYYTSIVIPVPDTTYVDRQVFVGSVRCMFRPWGSCSLLSTYEYSYDAATDRLYLNAGGGAPQDAFISSRSAGFDLLSCNNLIVDGFTVLRTRGRGIRIRGTGSNDRSRSVTIKNCVSAYNWNRGIHVEHAAACSLLSDTTYANGKHGIYLHLTDSSVVAYNESFANDDPLSAWGGVAGIKIGDSSDPASTTHVTVDYNAAHDNEDSGIDLHGSSDILVRRNLSYRNGDHGYDNLNTDGTRFLNDVALRNNHDGISIENGSDNVWVYNCILAYNALEAQTLVSDENVGALFVMDTTGFRSDNNVLVGDTPGVLYGARRRVFVQFLSVACDSMAEYMSATAGAGLDANSRSADPVFADTLNGDFTIASVWSKTVDRGRADVAGWLSVDGRGFVPHDNSAVPDSGAGSPAYADIGAYEYDVAPAKITDLDADLVTSSSVHLIWTAAGDDGMVGTAPSADLRYSTTAITPETFGSATPADPQPSPGSPGSAQGFTVDSLPMCTEFNFGLKYGGGNDQWAALSDTVIETTRPVWINGHWACEEGERARRAGDDRVSTGPGGVAVAAGTLGPEAASVALCSHPLKVEVAPGPGGLDVRLVVLGAESVPGFVEGAGVLYQTPGSGGGWTTRLQYALPAGGSLALLAPERPGCWVFLEPLAIREVASALLADGTLWQLAEARHSRLGDVTATVGESQPPELNAGDTLAVRYAGTRTEGGSLPGWLVLLDRPADGTMATRARGEPREPNASPPFEFALHPNQPNPFARTTTFRIDLPLPAMVRLEVFDLMGRRVAKLREALMPPGRHAIDWEARDSRGAPVRPGIYICRLAAGGHRAERKLVVLP